MGIIALKNYEEGFNVRVRIMRAHEGRGRNYGSHGIQITKENRTTFVPR